MLASIDNELSPTARALFLARQERLKRMSPEAKPPVLEIVPPPPPVVVITEPTPTEQISRLEAQIAAIKAAYPDAAVADREPKPTVYPTIARIKEIVGAFYGVSMRELVSSTRDIRATFARQVVMYLSKRMTIKSFPEIGRALGGRDHTTALHGFRKISKYKDDLVADLSRLERAISTGSKIEGEPEKRWVTHKHGPKENRVVVPFINRAPRSDSWTSNEDARVLEMRAQGQTIKMIARTLGRTYEATQSHMKRLRERGRGVLPHGKDRSEHCGSC